MDSRRRRTELIARREFMGYSQEQLAHRLEVAVASLSCWERVSVRPRPASAGPSHMSYNYLWPS